MTWIQTKYAPVMLVKVREWVKIVFKSVAFPLLPSRVMLYDDFGAASFKIVLLQLSLCISNTKHILYIGNQHPCLVVQSWRSVIPSMFSFDPLYLYICFIS